jgi:hypothetical protein
VGGFLLSGRCFAASPYLPGLVEEVSWVLRSARGGLACAATALLPSRVPLNILKPLQKKYVLAPQIRRLKFNSRTDDDDDTQQHDSSNLLTIFIFLKLRCMAHESKRTLDCTCNEMSAIRVLRMRADERNIHALFVS